MPRSIHHMNDIRWMEVDVGEEEAQLPKQHTGSSVWALYCSFGLQTLAWSKLLLIGKKLAFKFSTYIFEYQPLLPYVHLASTHVMKAPRPSLFFAGLLLRVLKSVQPLQILSSCYYVYKQLPQKDIQNLEKKEEK